MAQPKTLNEVQVGVLRWIGDGCPDGVMESVFHRISAGALRNRGYARTSGRGQTWSAQITPAGLAFLAELDGPNPPELRKPNSPKADGLIDEVIAAGGSLRVPSVAGQHRDREDYEKLARRAVRQDRVPAGLRLRVGREGDDVVIELVDDAVDPAPPLVEVPATVGRLHPAVRDLRDRPERHDVSRAHLDRLLRVAHALAVEAERRGHEVSASQPKPDPRGYRSPVWRSTQDGHLTFTVRGCSTSIRLSEQGLANRAWFWDKQRGWGQPKKSEAQICDEWEAKSTGRLSIEIASWGGHGRRSKWSDRAGSLVDDLLGDVLWEIERRATDADDARAEAERQKLRRRLAWESAMVAARDRHTTNVLDERLTSEVKRWKRAADIRAYCAAILDQYADNPTTAAWARWATDRANAIDPLREPPRMPKAPAPNPEALRPFLDGHSPYGPDDR